MHDKEMKPLGGRRGLLDKEMKKKRFTKWNSPSPILANLV